MSLSLLSRPMILEQLGKGIIIEPFSLEQLKNCSYDLRLGKWYFRKGIQRTTETGDIIFNPYDLEMVRNHYGEPIEAKPASNFPLSQTWKHIHPDHRIIIMEPGEMILGHTEEFIGGTKDPESGRCFTAELKARSSVGRVGFEVCRCAGWGDVGYVNRWTMEIVCTSTTPTVLVVGTRLAQMKFYEVAEVEDSDLYGYNPTRDHYQTGVDIKSIRKAWRPKMLLPHLTTD